MKGTLLKWAFTLNVALLSWLWWLCLNFHWRLTGCLIYYHACHLALLWLGNSFYRKWSIPVDSDVITSLILLHSPSSGSSWLDRIGETFKDALIAPEDDNTLNLRDFLQDVLYSLNLWQIHSCLSPTVRIHEPRDQGKQMVGIITAIASEIH